MTGHYARLHDTTVRRHWEAARKISITGQAVTLDPDGPLAEAAWAKQRLGRVTQALPNGFCGLPVQKTCPHANSCLTCPMFVPTPAFLPRHRARRQQIAQLRDAAGRDPARRVPADQRASDPSLGQRLQTACERNRQLTEDNRRLRRQLAEALGQLRTPGTLTLR